MPFSSVSHDVVLPIWKSNVSLSLMIDKKAKRFVFLTYLFLRLYAYSFLKSALSLRLLGSDITNAENVHSTKSS